MQCIKTMMMCSIFLISTISPLSLIQVCDAIELEDFEWLHADINMDGIVDEVIDTVILTTRYGEEGTIGWTRADINNDGVVDIVDTSALTNQQGQSYTVGSVFYVDNDFSDWLDCDINMNGIVDQADIDLVSSYYGCNGDPGWIREDCAPPGEKDGIVDVCDVSFVSGYYGETNKPDFTTIQEAIDASDDGDIVYICIGDYYENIVINKKICLIGESAEHTVIHGNDQNVITITADDTTVSNLQITEGNKGIYLDTVESCVLKNLLVCNSNSGIYLKNSDLNTVSDTKVYDNIDALIMYSSKENAINQNTVYNNGGYGIFSQYMSHDNIISNNVIYDNGEGLIIGNSNNNIITNNNIDNNNYNFVLNGWSEEQYTHDIDTSNTINDKLLFYIKDEKDKTYDNSYDIGFFAAVNCENIILENQELTNNFNGILFWNTHNSAIINNQILHNDYGAFIRQSSNIIFTQNTVDSNDRKGIYLDSCTDCEIYHNDFWDNNPNALDDADNTWDNGYPSGGNFWSDYTGTDANNDGIGDTPYHSIHLNNLALNENTQDNYPFVTPNGWEITPLETTVDGPYSSYVGASISFTAEVNGGIESYSYSWDFGDGETSTEQNPSHVYISAGTFTVTITITDSSQQTAVAETTAVISAQSGGGDNNDDDEDDDEDDEGDEDEEVNADLLLPVANFTYFTEGLMVTFTDLSIDPDGEIINRTWKFGDSAQSHAQNPIHTYDEEGTYSVNLTVADNESLCASIEKIIIVTSQQAITATIDIDPDVLNKKSNGKWITCYIELPEENNVEDIIIQEITLNKVIPAETTPYEIGDYDSDTIPDLMVKFDRTDLIQIISTGEQIILSIDGKTVEGIVFRGEDSIRVIGNENSPPNQPTNEQPINHSEWVDPRIVFLNCTVSDIDDDLLDVEFYWKNGTLIGIDKGVKSNTQASVTLNKLSFYTKYQWYVIVSDGEQAITSPFWWFTTEAYPWDLNRDGKVDQNDTTLLTYQYGSEGPPGWIREDINDDGEVDILDVSSFVSHFGEEYEPLYSTVVPNTIEFQNFIETKPFSFIMFFALIICMVSAVLLLKRHASKKHGFLRKTRYNKNREDSNQKHTSKNRKVANVLHTLFLLKKIRRNQFFSKQHAIHHGLISGIQHTNNSTRDKEIALLDIINSDSEIDTKQLLKLLDASLEDILLLLDNLETKGLIEINIDYEAEITNKGTSFLKQKHTRPEAKS